MSDQREFRRALIDRDHGCVFCHVGYRADEHAPLPDYDYHFRKGKAFSCCEYHAYFLRTIWPSLLPKRREMEKLLDEYLRDKEDPRLM